MGAPCTSTESRLLVTAADLDLDEKSYNNQEYMEQLMRHNTIGRASLHDLGALPRNSPEAVPGLDSCYDCAAFTATIRSYLAARRGQPLASVLGMDVAQEIRAIISEFAGGRNLATPYHVSYLRHTGRQFSKRKYVDSSGANCFSVETSEPSWRRPRRRKARVGMGAGVAIRDGEELLWPCAEEA